MKLLTPKNILYLLIVLFSIGSLVVFVKTTEILIAALQLQSGNDLSNREKILGNGLNYEFNQILFTVTLFIILFQLFLSTFLYRIGNKKDKMFALISTIFGGIGIHLLFLLFVLMKIQRIFPKHRFQISSKKILLVFPVTLFLIPVATLVIVVSIDFTYSKVVKYENIILSTRAKNENLIEIFSDGLDGPWLLKAIKQKEKTHPNFLKDFIFFENFLSPSQLTDTCLPGILAGIDYLPGILDLTKKHFKTYSEFAYSQGFSSLTMKKLDDQRKKGNFAKSYIIGTYGQSTSWSFEHSFAGNVDLLSKKDNKNFTINYDSAKRYLTNGWGISTDAPDTMLYNSLLKNIKASEETVGKNIYISDEIAHGPFVTKEDGSLNILLSNSKESTKAWLNQFHKLISGLNKKIYDNSLIIVWSDHGSHARPEITPQKIEVKKIKGSFLVKLPHANKKTITINENTMIWAPYLHKIIEKLLQEKSNINFEFNSWIKNNPNFQHKELPLLWNGKNGKDEWVFYKKQDGILSVIKNEESQKVKLDKLKSLSWK